MKCHKYWFAPHAGPYRYLHPYTQQMILFESWITIIINEILCIKFNYYSFISGDIYLETVIFFQNLITLVKCIWAIIYDQYLIFIPNKPSITVYIKYDILIDENWSSWEINTSKQNSILYHYSLNMSYTLRHGLDSMLGSRRDMDLTPWPTKKVRMKWYQTIWVEIFPFAIYISVF